MGNLLIFYGKNKGIGVESSYRTEVPICSGMVREPPRAYGKKLAELNHPQIGEVIIAKIFSYERELLNRIGAVVVGARLDSIKTV